jgi:hypothetical protein
MSSKRELLSQLIKQWAQDHHTGYAVADPASGDEGLENTQGYYTWLIRESHANVDFLSLVDRLDLLFDKMEEHDPSGGMFCKKCNNFYDYAEPNQLDGSLICYSCRKSP